MSLFTSLEAQIQQLARATYKNRLKLCNIKGVILTKTVMQKTLHADENLTLELPTLENAEELFSVVDANREHLRKFLDWVDKTTAVEPK